MFEDDILEYDPNIKNKLKRFKRDYEFKILNKKDTFFINYDKSFLKIDRILDCTELFPIIHPKKASQIKNKWSRHLLSVMRFLINFEFEGKFHGIFFLNLSS